MLLFKVTKKEGNSQSLTVFLEVRDDHSEKNPEFLLWEPAHSKQQVVLKLSLDGAAVSAAG